MINNYEIPIKGKQNPLACYNQLHPYRERTEKLTPEICREFLSKSDNHKIINELLEAIAAELEENSSEYPQYTEILLGCIINRNCREDNLQKIAELEHRFSQIENSHLADYILVVTLAQHLKQDRSKELNDILHHLPKEDATAITRELEYQEKILNTRKKQQEILKAAKQAADGKDIWHTSITADNGCEVNSQIDLEHCGTIHFAENAERINIYQPIPQTSNLSELQNLYTFWPSGVDLTDYVVDLPKCTHYVILWAGKAPKELDLSHLPRLKGFNGNKEDFSNTQIFFPYGKELDELMLFDIEKFPDEFDLTVLSSIKRFRTNCPFKEHHNCRLPRKVDTLELARIKQESGIIDFSSIKQVNSFHIEEAKLGENVEIRFPQQVEQVIIDHTCISIPKRLDLNVKGLKKLKIDFTVQDCIEEIILPQGFEIMFPFESKVKITYANPEERKTTLQNKPSFLKKLFSKTR